VCRLCYKFAAKEKLVRLKAQLKTEHQRLVRDVSPVREAPASSSVQLHSASAEGAEQVQAMLQ